jgi:hypothetical protein
MPDVAVWASPQIVGVPIVGSVLVPRSGRLRRLWVSQLLPVVTVTDARCRSLGISPDSGCPGCCSGCWSDQLNRATWRAAKHRFRPIGRGMSQLLPIADARFRGLGISADSGCPGCVPPSDEPIFADF